jgi:uncharacterized protein (DUF1800 family)
MENTADWISRRAGFGFRLSEDPISEKQWFTNARNSVENSKSYISNNRIKPLLKSIKRGLKDEERKIYSGITLNQTAAIVYRNQLEKEEKRAEKAQEDPDRVYTLKARRPIWLSAIRRADLCLNTKEDFANRLWLFWLNYFTVSQANSNGPCIPHFHEMIRKNMFGNMSGLVFKVISHSAMILYLDNNNSTGENSKARKEKWTTDGTNENLARETLELYTVTPGNGYTQDDVNGMTNILTGWKVKSWDNVYKAQFVNDYHEPGTHKVLGKKYKSTKKGTRQLKDVVEDLTALEDTARHVSFRLCQHFISDEPNPKHVEQLTAIYIKNKGKLTALYLGLLDILQTLEHEQDKFLNPEVWAYQSLKTLNVGPPTGVPLVPSFGRFKIKNIDSILQELGLLHGKASQPNGWAEVEDDWLSNEYLDRRVSFSALFGVNPSYKSDTCMSIKKSGFSVTDLERFNLSQYSQAFVSDSRPFQSQFVTLLCSPGFLRS